MDPGYVVAALLEVAGLGGLMVAARVIRTERDARMAALRTVLRSGQNTVAVGGPDVARRWRLMAPRIVDVPVATQRSPGGTHCESAARSALIRAIVRPSCGLATSVSAG